MQARRISLREISARDEAAWRRLAGDALEPNPFFEPECALAVAQHSAGLSLLVAEDRDRFHACMPIRHERRWRKLPRPVATTLGSSGVELTLAVGTPLVAPDAGLAATRTLLAGIAATGGPRGPGIAALDLVGDDGPVAGLVRTAAEELRLPLRTYESSMSGMLRRVDGRLRPPLRGDRRRAMARRRRRLGEALGGPVELVDRAGDARAVEDFLRLEASGWKATRGQAYANRRDEAEWFRDLCERFAAAGRLHLLSLEVAGRPVAMQCCLRSGAGIFFFRIAHDDALSRYGPGVQVVVSAIEHLEGSTDVTWLDSCADANNAHMRELFPDPRPLSAMLIGFRGPVSRALVASVPAARRVQRAVGRLRASAGTRRPSRRTA